MPSHLVTTVGIKLHRKLGRFLSIYPRFFRGRAVDGAPHSQKDSVEANGGHSSVKMLMEHAELLVRGFHY